MMKVWLLYDCSDRLEGVYSEAAKQAKEQQIYEQALASREHRNDVLAQEIKELKSIRQPYIEEAERLLAEERVAKETNNTFLLKEARKQRKVALRQADKLTGEIGRKQTKIHNSLLLTHKQIVDTYGVFHYWDEQYVMEVN